MFSLNPLINSQSHTGYNILCKLFVSMLKLFDSVLMECLSLTETSVSHTAAPLETTVFKPQDTERPADAEWCRHLALILTLCCHYVSFIYLRLIGHIVQVPRSPLNNLIETWSPNTVALTDFAVTIPTQSISNSFYY